MDKQEKITILEKEHQLLKKILDNLNEKQIIESTIIGNWTVKDVLAHLSAWNWEDIKGVDLLTKNQKPWSIDIDDKEVDLFNQQEITDRKHWPIKLVIQEWEDSFNRLIVKLGQVTDDHWSLDTKLKYADGKQLTIESFFEYSYNGEGHEGGHAKQIVEAFKLKDEA